MNRLHITLFGRLSIRYGGRRLTGCESQKVRELLCYLLVFRNRPHAREALASLLWGERHTTVQSKKYLRNALWRLQASLSKYPDLAESGLLIVEQDWVQLNLVPSISLDVDRFEQAYLSVKGIRGSVLESVEAEALKDASRLYRADFMENWYQDWCVCERERLLQLYLIMLDKLIEHCEVRGHYEAGLTYGQRILQYDRAREVTHQQLMRLYYLAGDRTGALRQYQRCAAALTRELDVEPSQRTKRLLERVRSDRLLPSTGAPGHAGEATGQIMISLQQLEGVLGTIQKQIREVLRNAESARPRT